jgi:predicted amidohydrolase YtcJ
VASTEATAWVDGRVYTGRRRVEAVLVEDGRISVAGSSEEVRRHRGTGTTVRRLGQKVLVPGLVDSHCHVRSSVLMEHGVDLRPCRSVNQIVDRLREAALRSPAGPLLGWGWDETGFPIARYPMRDDLDQVSVDRPVVAYRRCLHVAAANSEALRAMALDGAVSNPPGGRLGRIGTVLDGLLYDSALDHAHTIESRRFATLETELEQWLNAAAARGITTLVAMSSDLDELHRLRELYASRQCPVRVRAYVRPDQLAPLDAEPELRTSEELRVTGVKAFADGALGARTAWLSEPYADAPDERGESLLEPSRLGDIAREAADRQLGIAVHAIGDRAIHQVLTVFRSEPPFGTPRIEHASLTPPELLPEFASVRPALVVQPSFLVSDTWIPQRLGPERARWAYAFRYLIGLGLHVAGSSDSPVEVMDPWAGMAAATAPRPGPSEVERLTPTEAFTMYTREAGAALREPEIGSLEPGAFADMVLLDARDWPTALRRGSEGVLATYRNGHAVFERAPESPAPTLERAQAL